MRSIKARPYSRKLAGAAAAVLLAGSTLFAQSTLQDHPTPVTRNEVEATIKARDVGDARLTTHYYWFEGAQGDVFINWTSKNFAGDVDLFLQNGLRSLTKIVVYADFGEVETGRAIYLRKPERLLLRVQGRTPNDDVATYRLKFAGSFIAATTNEKDVPILPSVGENVTGVVRVNSVGTILPPIAKPAETKTESASETSGTILDVTEAAKNETDKPTEEKRADAEEVKRPPKLEVVVEDPIKKAEPPRSSTVNRPPRRTRGTRNTASKKVEPKAAIKSEENDAAISSLETQNKPVEKTIEEPNKSSGDKARSAANADPLANVNLVILFKDGSKIERPLPEVFRFSVDRGVLTVIAKDGRAGKYQMINVAKVTIE